MTWVLVMWFAQHGSVVPVVVDMPSETECHQAAHEMRERFAGQVWYRPPADQAPYHCVERVGM